MKSLKKEIITIVALLVVALIGTYVVNASTGSNQLQKPAVEKEVAAVQPAIENNPLEKKEIKIAATQYCLDQCQLAFDNSVRDNCAGLSGGALSVCEKPYKDIRTACITACD